MTEKAPTSTEAPIPEKTPEKRFPKAAVDYIDALLRVQRDRFEREQALAQKGTPGEWPPRPMKLQLLAEGDNFVGSGWGQLDHAKNGTGRRWMARIGTLLVSADLGRGGTLMLKGNGYLKRRYVRELTVWMDDFPVEGKIRRLGLNGWQFEGVVPQIPARPFHILRLQTTGIRPHSFGPDTHASLALSEVTFSSGA